MNTNLGIYSAALCADVNLFYPVIIKIFVKP